MFLFVCAEANKYFVDYISKAYQALTDKVARENYEKYGHPDGRQVCTIINHQILQIHDSQIYYSRSSS
jgi:preprotein translocase subunit Sec63